MPAVQFQNIVKHYGDVTVLENLDLDVADGEFVVLLGPSGCGKTTLLNILAGPHRRDAGRILIDDRDVTDLDPKDRGLAMVFQSYALYPTKTVRGNLQFGLSSRRLARDEIERRIGWAAKLLQIDAARPQAGAAFGRTAPARRDRPRAGQAGRRLPLRRTAVQSRRQAAHRDADGDQEAARPAEATRSSTSRTTRSRR